MAMIFQRAMKRLLPPACVLVVLVASAAMSSLEWDFAKTAEDRVFVDVKPTPSRPGVPAGAIALDIKLFEGAASIRAATFHLKIGGDSCGRRNGRWSRCRRFLRGKGVFQPYGSVLVARVAVVFDDAGGLAPVVLGARADRVYKRAQKEDGGENAEHQMEKVVLKQVLHVGQPSFGRISTSSAACRTIAASISGALVT